MNIFCLDYDPVEAAKMHCNKHIAKMVTELSQLLSTAHRVLDGKMEIVTVLTKSGKYRKKKVWSVSSNLDSILYKATHINHPSNIWTRECAANYDWNYRLFIALCDEYTYRYGKIHLSDKKLREVLKQFPSNINRKTPLTPFALAMNSRPECIDKKDPVGSYRKFYMTKQERMKMVWTNRQIPEWFKFHEVC